MKLAIIGATGCIGKTLLYQLLAKTKHTIVASFRNEKTIDAKLKTKQITWKQIDLDNPVSIADFLQGCDELIYLVHSLESKGLERVDVQYAENVGKIAKQTGIKKIIYMGVLTPKTKNLSEHLQTKQETGNMLAAFGIPVAEIRISILLAQCSASYQMLKTIALRFPILIGPSSLNNLCSPIAVSDVVKVILAVINKKVTKHEIIEISSDILSYKELIQSCGESIKGFKNTILTVPFLPKKLIAFLAPYLSGEQSTLASSLIGSLYSGNSIPTKNHFEELTGENPLPVEKVLHDLTKLKN